MSSQCQTHRQFLILNLDLLLVHPIQATYTRQFFLLNKLWHSTKTFTITIQQRAPILRLIAV